jgi:spore maturation protein CgeB
MRLGYTFNFYGDLSNDLLGDELADLTNFHPKVYYEDKSRVFFEALCVLNLPHPSAWNSITCRVFEVLASGGILVTPRNEAILQLLQDRVHAFLYSDFDELVEILGVIHSGEFDRKRMIVEMKTLSTTNSLRERALTILNGLSETIS